MSVCSRQHLIDFTRTNGIKLKNMRLSESIFYCEECTTKMNDPCLFCKTEYALEIKETALLVVFVFFCCFFFKTGTRPTILETTLYMLKSFVIKNVFI